MDSRNPRTAVMLNAQKGISMCPTFKPTANS